MPPAKPTRWPVLTVLLLLVGYSGYYLCRSHLSVARPLILDDYPHLDKAAIGLITSIGTLAYAVGKFVWGSLADQMGGRRAFLIGMVGAIVCTLVFALGGPPLFLAAWVGNRFLQSAGWGGMVHITGRWFSHSTYGRVMAVLSLSYLFGDFASRLFLGELIERGAGWQTTFYVAAGVLAVILVPTWILLRNRPDERGLPNPAPAPRAVKVERRTVLGMLRPLFRRRAFWTVCALSFGFTLMRETFNEWTPTYLHEVAGMAEGAAAKASSLFPLFGGLSVLLIGFLSDRVGALARAKLVVLGLMFGVAALSALAWLPLTPFARVAVIAATAFVLIGPYSLLAGAISLDFGGAEASASAAGWIDGVGYLGGILSGYSIAKLAQTGGWSSAYAALVVVAALSAFVGALYVRQEAPGRS